MGQFNFTIPGSLKKITIDGPASLTEAQARAIFDEQVKAGSFVGTKPGDIINSATQASGGLKTALSQVAQTVSATTGSIQSVATKAISGVTNAIKSTSITQGINLSNFAKEGPALNAIDKLSPTDVQAGLAQYSKLVGQSASQLTNTLGAGKFGLDVSQLEKVGVLKAGTSAQLSAGSSLTSVLKSPANYTGKLGVGSIDDLLSSPAKQNQIQQQLMTVGASAVKQLGIPLDKLSASAATGVVMNSAKSIDGTVKWATGQSLPSDVKSTFDSVAKNSAFSVDLAAQKLNNAMKQEIVPEPASDTVNRETLDAASNRVVGNAKVPEVDYTDKPPVVNLVTWNNEINAQTKRINDTLDIAIAVASKTDAQRLPILSSEIITLENCIATYNEIDGKLLELLREGKIIERETGSKPPQIATIEFERQRTAAAIKQAEIMISKLKATAATKNNA